MAEFDSAKELLPKIALALAKLKIICGDARTRAGQVPVVELDTLRDDPPLWLSPERFASSERLSEALQSTMGDIEVAGASLGSRDGTGPFGMYLGRRPNFPKVVGKAVPQAVASLEGYLAACADPASLADEPIDFIRFGLDSFEAISKSAGRELGNLFLAACSVGRAVTVIEQYEAALLGTPPYTTSIETAAGIEMGPDNEPALMAGLYQIGLNELAVAVQKGEISRPDRIVMQTLTTELAATRLEAQVARGGGHWTLLDQQALHRNVHGQAIPDRWGP